MILIMSNLIRCRKQNKEYITKIGLSEGRKNLVDQKSQHVFMINDLY